VPLPDGRVALIVGDVVGHGITASAVMGRLRTVLSEHLADGDPLADALAALDRSAHRIAGAAATTVCVALMDRESGQVEYCTAGHPAPLVVSGGDWRYLPTTGAGPLASGTGFATGTAELGDGDVLFLYSDGLVERPGRPLGQSTVEIGRAVTDALAGRPRLSGAATHPADRICEQTLETLTRVTGYADDITVLAARRIGAPAPLLSRASADQAAVWSLAVELERWLAAVDAGVEDQSALRHAVVELLSNSVEHAYRDREPGAVSLSAELGDDGHVTVTVADHGTWRNPDESQVETRAHGDPRLRGLGLALVADIVDEFTVDRTDGRTVARLRRRLRRPAPLLAEAPGGVGRRGTADLDSTLTIDSAHDQLTVRGPLMLATAGALETRLGWETRGGTRSLTLDLSGLTHLASTGVKLLQHTRAAAALHGQKVTLLASPGSVAHHVLELTAMEHDLTTSSTAEDGPHWSA
jgi:anti-sigma regulatory factor (Ser/Thr protein kinase)/anti-anti-sigma regulatory factor